MAKNHIKRINAPKRWNILRKKSVFISRPNPGRSMDMSISLNTVLKEMLELTRSTKESKYLIKHKGVLVNGAKRHDEKFPVGFLDVVSLSETGDNYRLIVDSQNKLAMIKIPATEASVKLSKISNRKLLKNNFIQINCTDGRNFIFAKDDTSTKGLAINDTLSYTMPDQKIKELFKLEKGSLAFLYKGKHAGRTVKIHDFKSSNIVFKDADAQTELETKKAYAFAIGKDKPAITVTAMHKPKIT